MKKSLFLILLVFAFAYSNAQKTFIILNDVSGSLQPKEMEDLKQATIDLLMGNQINQSLFKALSGSGSFKVNPGDKIMVMPFGDKLTVMSYTPELKVIANQNDVDLYIKSKFRTKPTDSRTYLNLAISRCAMIAHQNSIMEYTLIIASDNINDDFGGSKTGYTPDEQDIVNLYSTIATISPASKFVYNTRKAVTLSVNPINLKGYGGVSDQDGDSIPDTLDNCPNTPPGTKVDQFGCPDTIPDILKITLSSYGSGTTQKPISCKENNLTITWSCPNAPKNAKYKIRLSPVNNPGAKPKPPIEVVGNSYNIQNLEDGKWKITVSASNFQSSSDNTVIEVNSGGSLGFLWVLIIIIAGAAGYWYWSKKRKEKEERKDTFGSDDGFGSGTKIHSNPDDSGYF